MDERIVVVGAGLSGLAAAYRLKAAGHDVIVLERSAQVGGCAATVRCDGYVIDTGCDLINTSFTRYLRLVDELGLSDRIVPSGTAVDFIREGRPFGLDAKRPLSVVRTPLLSRASKAQAARGIARLIPEFRRFDAYDLTQYADDAYGSGADFIAQYFNDEIAAYAIDPLVRAFTGSPLANANGLAVMATLAVGTESALAVRGGMSVLPEALAVRLDVRCGAEATGVSERGDGVAVTYRDAEGEHELEAAGCVLAVSYEVAAGMWPTLEESAPGFREKLRDLALISISVGYAAESPTAAYPVMVPSRESRDALLAFMQHNKSPDRAPAGKTLVTIFTDAQVTHKFLKRSDEELTEWATGLIEGWYPSLRGHRELVEVTRWPHVGYIPFPGFWEAIDTVQREVSNRRVHTTSALFGSGGVERAVLGGERAADRLLSAARETASRYRPVRSGPSR
jgi:protoporphyrinogen oxidase